jgi:hypothetical protein
MGGEAAAELERELLLERSAGFLRVIRYARDFSNGVFILTAEQYRETPAVLLDAVAIFQEVMKEAQDDKQTT